MEKLSTHIHQSVQEAVKNFTDAEKIIQDLENTSSQDASISKVSSLYLKCEDLSKLNKKAKVSGSKKLKMLQNQADVKKTKLSAEEKIISALTEELHHLDMEKATVEKVSSQKVVSEQKKKVLEETESLFKTYLATEIIKVKGGWMQVVFTELDPRRPDRKFFFSLKLDESRHYIVGDCYPEIDDIHVLQQKLNSTNDLAKFINSLRKRFKNSIQN